jgi:dienelactone hydrolase
MVRRSCTLLTSLCLLTLVFGVYRAAAGVATEKDGKRLGVSELVEVRDFSGVSLSPDGRYLSFRLAAPSVGRNSTVLTWYVVDTAGRGVARRIADGGKPDWMPGYGLFTSETPIWDADSKSMFFRIVDHGKASIWNCTIEGHLREMTHDDADIEAFELDSHPARLVYATGPTRSDLTRAEADVFENGILLDDSVEWFDHIYKNSSYHGRPTTVRRASQAALLTTGLGYGVTLLGSLPPQFKELELSTGAVRAVLGSAVRSQALLRGVSANGSIDLQNSDMGQAYLEPQSAPNASSTGHPRLGQVYSLVWKPAGQRGEVRCPDIDCSGQRMRGLAWRPGTSEIVFLSESASGKTTMRSWDTRSNAVRMIFQTDALLGSGASLDRYESRMCPLSKTFAFCTIAGADTPPRLVRIDLLNGKTTTIFDPNRGLSSVKFVPVEHLEWRDKWARAITGILVLPSNATPPLPLVITGYRCTGFLRGGSGSDAPEYVLAASGLATLCVNFDMATMYNEPYPARTVPTGEQANTQSNLDAWESGIDLLVRRGLIDENRIGVIGSSFGAVSVHYALSRSTRISVAAATEPDISDPFNYFVLSAEGATGRSILEQYNMPDPLENRTSFYRQFSAALRAPMISAPLMIQTSELEYRFGAQYYAALRDANRPFEFYVFPAEAHQFMQAKHRAAWSQRFVDWFRFWLEGQEDSSQAKKDQYSRWERLCDLQKAANPDNKPAFCVGSSH